LRKEQTLNLSGQCPHLSAVNLLKIASKFPLQSPFFLLPKTLKNRLFASFRAACCAAEKRDYAHQSETCQTLLRRNLYFSAKTQEALPATQNQTKNKPLKHNNFLVNRQEKGLLAKP